MGICWSHFHGLMMANYMHLSLSSHFVVCSLRYGMVGIFISYKFGKCHESSPEHLINEHWSVPLEFCHMATSYDISYWNNLCRLIHYTFCMQIHPHCNLSWISLGFVPLFFSVFSLWKYFCIWNLDCLKILCFPSMPNYTSFLCFDNFIYTYIQCDGIIFCPISLSYPPLPMKLFSTSVPPYSLVSLSFSWPIEFHLICLYEHR